MDFRQLEYFCTLSRLKNFTRTAEELHVSQPSVTKAIKSLETELKLTLIDRRQKHVTLTNEGKAFLLHAEQIMKSVEDTYRDMERFQLEKQGTVHFGIPPMVEAYLFPDLFTSFKAMYPDMNLDVKEYGDSTEVMEKANSGELDFGIIFSSRAEEMSNKLLIMTDNMSLCVSLPVKLISKLNYRPDTAMLSALLLFPVDDIQTHHQCHQPEAIGRQAHIIYRLQIAKIHIQSNNRRHQNDNQPIRQLHSLQLHKALLSKPQYKNHTQNYSTAIALHR